jgi:DeoR/GlpR family transcriptional regulator of sugar metabolism
LDADFGLSEFDWEIVELKQAVIRASRKVVSLTLSAKLNSIQRYKVADLKSIHTLITELDPHHKQLEKFQKQGLDVL